MYEVERKVRTDHRQVRERLEARGATRVGRVTQEDTYYDAPDRSFADTDEALRVRREIEGEGADDAERVLLTYKGPLVDGPSKTREEAQTRVADQKALRAILEGLGYEAAATVRKQRDRYTAGDCLVTLDRVDGLGTFVEVEYHEPVPREEIDRARRTVAELLADLGLDPGDGIQTSYLELVLAGE